MNKLTNALLGAILVALVVVFVVIVGAPIPAPVVNVEIPEVNLGGIEDLTRSGSATFATATVGITVHAAGTWNVVAQAKSDAKYRMIQNFGANDVWCNLGATTTLAQGSGIFIASSTGNGINTYEMSVFKNLYWGKIYCVASNATTTLNVVQY